MMRQLDGAFGISAVNTYTARRIAVHRTDLLVNITDTNNYAIGRLNSLISYFERKGFNPIDAKK